MSEDRERQDQMSAGGNQQSGELVYWWVPRGEERVFELPGWSAEARQLVRTLFAGSDVGHRWEGDKVVVPGESRDDAAALLDEIVAASRPQLDAQADRVGYEMVDWPQHEVELLRQTLTDKEIIHEFTDDEELLVYEGDEATVDALFEELGLLGPNPGVELDGETLTSLLNDLYLATDRLSRVATDPDAVVAAARSVGVIDTLAVPFGFDEHAWQLVVSEAVGLRDTLEESEGDATDDEVSARARRLRDLLKPWL